MNLYKLLRIYLATSHGNPMISARNHILQNTKNVRTQSYYILLPKWIQKSIPILNDLDGGENGESPRLTSEFLKNRLMNDIRRL